MDSPLEDLLLDALLSPDPQARLAWQRWRVQADIDNLPYNSHQFFPALGPAFLDWIDQDAAAPIFKGIVRQAWSQNQIRLQRAVELDALFMRAGVQAAIAGPVAWALRTPPPAIRPIPYLTFLVPRRQVPAAWTALLDSGWTPSCDLPQDPWWDARGNATVYQGSLHVNLHWRLIPVPPEDTRDCEAAFLSRIEPIEWNQHALSTTTPEATLLHILCGERDGDLPWLADVALVGTRGVNWIALLDLAKSFAPLAIERLRELRAFSRFEIPQLPADHPGVLARNFDRVWKIYRAHSYRRKQSPSWPGFAEFLVTAGARKLFRAAPNRPSPK